MRRLFCLISVFLILFVFAGDAGFSRCSAAWAEEDDISGGGPNGEAYVRQLTMKDVQAMNPDSPVQAVFSNNGYLSALMGKYYYDYTGTSWVTDGKQEVFTVRSGEVTKLGYTRK